MMQFNIYEIVKIKIEPSKKTHYVKFGNGNWYEKQVYISIMINIKMNYF